MRLENKVAVITGAAQGIGRAIAERYVREGAHVLISDLDLERSETTAREIANDAERCSATCCDVTDAAQVRDLIALAIERYGRIDIVVANAGIGIAAKVVDITEAEFDAVMDVNVKGVFLTAQTAARAMQKQAGGGAIINIGSIAGKRALPDQLPYCISKAAVNHMTAVMGVALASDGIRVNAIGPGSVNTELMRKMVMASPEQRRTVLSRTPMGRAGEPEEIASVAVFLASDDASYVTGQVIFPDGGRLPLMYTVPVADEV